jgi:hydroxyacylglutathione hydrolase
MIDVRSFSVGPIQENAHLVRASGEAEAAVLVDPGEEPQKLLDAAEALRVKIEAILVTHCHFDHIGAVAPIAKATGAPVYCPRIEQPVLSDVMRWVPPGFGPFESWQVEHTLQGGERLTLAGLDIEVLFTPGHSPGHLTYAIAPAGGRAAGRGGDAEEAPDGERAGAAGEVGASGGDGAPAGEPPALLSGDVLFQGSVGRVDLPGGDWPTLQRSIATLMQRFPAETVVYPGHMGITTLQRELQTNPFLTELRQQAALAVPAQRGETSKQR